MKRPVRSEVDGTYTIKGKKYKELFGSREQVMNETAYKTEGLLTKDDLMYNNRGRIVSRKKFKTAKQEMRLEKYGYGAKKGKFGYVKLGKGTRKGSSEGSSKGSSEGSSKGSSKGSNKGSSKGSNKKGDEVAPLEEEL